MKKLLIAAAAALTVVGSANVASAQESYPPVPAPGIQFSALAPTCVGELPFIQYSIVPTAGFVLPNPFAATLTLLDVNRNVISTIAVSTPSGQIIWPGASVNPPDWPGWTRNAAGLWVPDPTDAVVRQGVTVVANVNSATAEAFAPYPSVDAVCADPENEESLPPPAVTVPAAPAARSLPRTGAGVDQPLLVGLTAVAVGGALAFIGRRRRQVSTA